MINECSKYIKDNEWSNCNCNYGSNNVFEYNQCEGWNSYGNNNCCEPSCCEPKSCGPKYYEPSCCEPSCCEPSCCRPRGCGCGCGCGGNGYQGYDGSNNPCRYTIAQILKNIWKCGCNNMVTVYLNGPGSLFANNGAADFDLRVAKNATATGRTERSTANLEGTSSIATGKIRFNATGQVAIPALPIDSRMTETDEQDIDINVTSIGTAMVDLSQGSARVDIPALGITGITRDQEVNVPIQQTKPIVVDTGAPDRVNIPALNVCCSQCSGPQGVPTSRGCCGQNRMNSVQATGDVCGCMRFHTEPTSIRTEGDGKFVDIAVAPSLSAKATIPSTQVVGTTLPKTEAVPLEGTATATVSVVSVPDSKIRIPRSGVSGRTIAQGEVPITAIGSNVNVVPLSGHAEIAPTPVAGVALTEGLPVTGRINMNTAIGNTPVSITGAIECVDNNVLVLRDANTNRKYVISLCDIIKISFDSFRGMQRMARIFEEACLNPNSCVAGIQKCLKCDIKQNGSIELYGKSTNNPLPQCINTKNILFVEGGVLWETVKGNSGCNCVNNVYSLCNVAGYSLQPEVQNSCCQDTSWSCQTWENPCAEREAMSFEAEFCNQEPEQMDFFCEREQYYSPVDNNCYYRPF